MFIPYITRPWIQNGFVTAFLPTPFPKGGHRFQLFVVSTIIIQRNRTSPLLFLFVFYHAVILDCLEFLKVCISFKLLSLRSFCVSVPYLKVPLTLGLVDIAFKTKQRMFALSTPDVDQNDVLVMALKLSLKQDPFSPDGLLSKAYAILVC